MSAYIEICGRLPALAVSVANQSGRQRVLALLRQRGVIRSRDLGRRGLDTKLLTRLEREGRIERRARGIYTLSDADLGERETLLEVATRIPHGVACLLTALSFHKLTTQNPAKVWLAIERDARAPRAQDLPLRVIRMSGTAFRAGIETHRINGVRVRVYDAPKTVVDCFKFRNKVGLDVAIEALRDYLRRRGTTTDALWRYARIDRVANIMRPYIEAVVGP
jgi:predicted transcriptional regulator of viral defense system